MEKMFSIESDSTSHSGRSENHTVTDSGFSSTNGGSTYAGSTTGSAGSYETHDFINGMIFVCDEHTTVDMFKHQIFGLPLPYLREMKMLVPGRSALFLIDKQTELVRGIFVPTCTAKKNLNDKIWLRKDSCSYPSQIKFELHSSFPALHKNSDLAPNYLRRMKIKGKFLDRHRVNCLVASLAQHKAHQATGGLTPYGSGSLLGTGSSPSLPSIDAFDPLSTLTIEQQLAVDRYLQQRRFFDRNFCGMPMMPSMSPSMNMAMMQSAQNDFLLHNMHNMNLNGGYPTSPGMGPGRSPGMGGMGPGRGPGMGGMGPGQGDYNPYSQDSYFAGDRFSSRV